MTSDKIKVLIDKYAKGTCSLEERQWLELWFEQQEGAERKNLSADDKARLFQRITAANSAIPFASRTKPNYLRWTAAAALVLSLIGGSYLLWQRQAQEQHTQLTHTPILPGENKATLTLSDGRQILLSDKVTETAKDQGISITKTASGLVKYTIDPEAAVGTGYNTIETPRGGQYEIALPDGSQVTLNAASSLRFAVNMRHQAQRIVELKGEGYFEVAKDAKRPFIVKSNQQEIQVLGTIFNVNSYQSSRSLTTLLEGSVLINKQKKLRPGQQAQVDGQEVKIKDVDVADYVDWKNNAFVFRNESLSSIMDRLSRWYNIEYTFDDPQTGDITFNGEVSRYAQVTDVIKLLRLTSKVTFDIQGRSIKIKNK